MNNHAPQSNRAPAPIGVFDSGYGGLTILREIAARLPEYDYLYFGDNARAPYGSRSFDVVYDFTLQAVKYLFSQGCRLVILACNTASAKALRSIQQNDLQHLDPERRVLGVIRPTIEVLPEVTESGHVGVLATPGTVNSQSYVLEVEKFAPHLAVTQQSCPMWVPLIENREANGPGADYFVEKYIRTIMERDPQIDTIVLGCTHYPLLSEKIRRAIGNPSVRILAQGDIVARSLADYLRRHPEIESRCSRGGTIQFVTSETPENFDDLASFFMSREVRSERVTL